MPYTTVFCTVVLLHGEQEDGRARTRAAGNAVRLELLGRT
jgi:hypothetical protein